jgi:glycerol-3-phosphate dehydrogenase
MIKGRIRERLKAKQNSTQVLMGVPNDAYELICRQAVANHRTVRGQCLFYLLKGMEAEKAQKGKSFT